MLSELFCKFDKFGFNTVLKLAVYWNQLKGISKFIIVRVCFWNIELCGVWKKLFFCLHSFFVNLKFVLCIGLFAHIFVDINTHVFMIQFVYEVLENLSLTKINGFAVVLTSVTAFMSHLKYYGKN